MRWIHSCAVTIAAITLISQAASASENFPKIVVTVAPLKPYVDAIVHGQGEADSLLRPGQEPHDFALSVVQAQMLDKADIVIVPDLGISPLLKRLLAKNKHAKVIELTRLEGAEPLLIDASNPWLDAMKAAPAPTSNQQHWWRKQNPKDVTKSNEAPAPRIWPIDGKKSEQPKPPVDLLPADTATLDGDKKPATDEKKDDQPITDPHIWLDPERMATIAVPLAKAISEQYPASRTELVANARALSNHLSNEVLPPLREMLNKPQTGLTAVNRPRISFITQHAAYQYFLQRFKLKHEGEISARPEQKLGAATIARMMNGAQDLNITCLIGEENGTMMSRIAKLTGARIVILSPEQLPERANVDYHEWLHNDYDRFLYVTAKAFSSCL